MTLPELFEVLKYVRKSIPCPNCQKRYNIQNISVLASTKFECLLELNCKYCKKSSLTDLVATPRDSTKNTKDIENHEIRETVPLVNQIFRGGINENDILDIKNFLKSFDGDFKKLFKN